MFRILIFNLLTLGFALSAQTDSLSTQADADPIILIVDEKPSCAVSHADFFSKHFVRPKATPKKFKATFKIVLTIGRDGTIESCKIIDRDKSDLNPKTNEPYGYVKEIERVINLLKQEQWFPAKKAGKPVRSKLSFDINLDRG